MINKGALLAAVPEEARDPVLAIILGFVSAVATLKFTDYGIFAAVTMYLTVVGAAGHHTKLVAWWTRRRGSQVKRVSEFRLHWVVAIPWYGGLLIGFQNLFALIAGIYSGLSALSPGQTLLVLECVAAGTTPFLGYLVGRRIGIKCERFGLLVALFAVPTGYAEVLLLQWLTMPSLLEMRILFEGMISHFRTPSLIGLIVLFCAVPAVEVLCVLAGFWSGRRWRIPAYLQHLGQSLSADSWRAITEKAYAEASALARK
jgi:hypothetical protein